MKRVFDIKLSVDASEGSTERWALEVNGEEAVAVQLAPGTEPHNALSYLLGYGFDEV